MITTEVTRSIRPNHVAATVTRDGVRLGHVTCKGRTFAASRKTGTATDLRRYATGFRTVDAAVRWITS